MSDYNELEQTILYSEKSKEGIEDIAAEFKVSVYDFLKNAKVKPSVFENAWNKNKLPNLKYFIQLADHYNVMLDELFNRRLK